MTKSNVPVHMLPGWRGSDLSNDVPEGSVDASTIVPNRLLEVHHGIFRCPYCGRTWDRGGHKEGFVKAAANNHVAMCYEILVWLAGYTLLWSNAKPIDTADQYYKRDRRRILATIAKRKREGWMPKMPPGSRQ